jgi:hypothetical protein
MAPYSFSTSLTQSLRARLLDAFSLLRGHAAFFVQPLYLLATLGADGVAEMVPEGGVELGVITLLTSLISQI